jgi:peptide/nickel transport system permease protein
MNNEVETLDSFKKITKTSLRLRETRRVLKVMFSRWVVVLGVVIILAFIIVAVFAPLIAPYSPIKQNLDDALQQPSKTHLLGTDTLGRDLLSRVIYGTRVSLTIGIVAVAIACLIGMTLGLIAGYFGGWINNIIMRIIDAMMAIPPLILAIVIATALGGGLLNILISLGISVVPGYCRMMCAQVLTTKENDYIIAAHAMGAEDTRTMLRHIIPNSFPTMVVLITLNIGGMILAEAGLSFMGIGIRPPTPAWGAMVSEGYKHLLNNPVLSFAPGIAIVLLVVAFNLVGDGLRDALDPRLRGTL